MRTTTLAAAAVAATGAVAKPRFLMYFDQYVFAFQLCLMAMSTDAHIMLYQMGHGKLARSLSDCGCHTCHHSFCRFDALQFHRTVSAIHAVRPDPCSVRRRNQDLHGNWWMGRHVWFQCRCPNQRDAPDVCSECRCDGPETGLRLCW